MASWNDETVILQTILYCCFYKVKTEIAWHDWHCRGFSIFPISCYKVIKKYFFVNIRTCNIPQSWYRLHADIEPTRIVAKSDHKGGGWVCRNRGTNETFGPNHVLRRRILSRSWRHHPPSEARMRTRAPLADARHLWWRGFVPFSCFLSLRRFRRHQFDIATMSEDEVSWNESVYRSLVPGFNETQMNVLHHDFGPYQVAN